MKRNYFLFLNILLILVIISNLFNPIEKIFQWITYPFDYVFSKLNFEMQMRKSNAESLKNILFIINDQNILLKETEDFQFEIPFGIILNKNDREILATANSKIKKNSKVIDENGVLVGFVEHIFSDRVIIRRLGWGNNEIFGTLNNVDVMIMEKSGTLYIELPENLEVGEETVFINLPYYVESIDNKNMAVAGKIISRSKELFIFEKKELDSILIYYFEE